MANFQNKTQPTEASVDEFLASVENDKRREDALELNELLKKATGAKPEMWGSSIVGFGTLHYVSPGGREDHTAAVGFSPRKAALTIYGILYYGDHTEDVEQLGSVTMGKGCVYIKDLSKIDKKLLAKLAKSAYKANANA